MGDVPVSYTSIKNLLAYQSKPGMTATSAAGKVGNIFGNVCN